MADYTSKIKDICESLASFDVNIEESKVVQVYVMGLASKFGAFRTEAANEIKVEGTEMMLTAIPNFSETGGVKAMRTDKGNELRSVSIVARKATGIASAGRSMPIRKEPGPDLVRDKSTK